ncbi:MAG: hypothetical protein IJW04_08285 [Ruminococcus sp.]|nr:hypothetical protein [Ruminococcus sp.]
MVNKLLKHEFTALSRMLVPMYIILLGLAVITRIIAIFETDTLIYDIILVSAVVVLSVGLVVGLVYTMVSCIIRFYRNLFSKEGYLTFTLPVSVNAHLLTKLFTSMVAYVASLGIIFISFCIATSGELLAEIFKAAGYILGKAGEALGANLGLYFAEFALLMLVSIAAGILLFYACMCIGQLAKRSRVLLALGVYFGYYYLTQFIVTIGIILLTVFEDSEAFMNLLDWIALNPEATIHIVLLGLTAFYAIMGGVYYLVAHTIMKKKLNLE